MFQQNDLVNHIMNEFGYDSILFIKFMANPSFFFFFVKDGLYNLEKNGKMRLNLGLKGTNRKFYHYTNF